MFNKLITIAALCALSAQAVYITEPSASDVVQCNTIQLTFSGKAPFTVSVWDGCNEDSTSTEPLADYHTNNTYAYWTVNVQEGKSVMFGITDNTGDYDWTNDFTVGNSNDASCVGVSPSFSSVNGTFSSPTTTAPLNNVGGAQTTTATSTSSVHAGPGAALGGALSSYTPRVELAAFVVIGSSIAAMLF